jgi:kynurenine formamidase
VNLPTEEDVLGYFTSLSNAGRWGEHDHAGTLNFITKAKRVAAAGLVRTGDVVSLAWEFDTSIKPMERIPPVRLMMGLGQGIRIDTDSDDKSPPQRKRQGPATEFLGLAYHGYRITHIDALSHWSWDGKLYNNYVAEAAVTPLEGARVLDTRPAGNLVTRGIFLDVARHRGIDWMPEGDLLAPDELQEMLGKASLTVEPGDILVLRTGNGRRMVEEGMTHLGSVPGPGAFHVANMPFFHERGVAALASDTANDRNRSEYANIPNPVHAVALTALGLWLVDNCNLEGLGEMCERLGTYEFALTMSAIPFRGATGSPVNPTAIF